MPLLWHITVNWGDFNKILNIMNVISSILLEQTNNAEYQTNKQNWNLVTFVIPDWAGLNFCDKLSIMSYLCTTLTLLILFSGNVDNDVVLLSTVAEYSGVLKLHTE